MNINWVDQVLHVVAGCLIAGSMAYLLIWWAGLLISMTVAGIREYWQHPGQCKAGCQTDLLFWLIGSLIGVTSTWLFAQGGVA